MSDEIPESLSPKAQAAYDEALRRIEECRGKGKKGKLLDLGKLELTSLPPEIGELRCTLGNLARVVWPKSE